MCCETRKFIQMSSLCKLCVRTAGLSQTILQAQNVCLAAAGSVNTADTQVWSAPASGRLDAHVINAWDLNAQWPDPHEVKRLKEAQIVVEQCKMLQLLVPWQMIHVEGHC